MRRIADGLADLERYSVHKRKQRESNEMRRRAESTGGGSLSMQDPNELILSTNLRDYDANCDRSPSLSPSTIRVSSHFNNTDNHNRHQNNTTTLFYNNNGYLDGMQTPSTNLNTSVTPNRMM